VPLGNDVVVSTRQELGLLLEEGAKDWSYVEPAFTPNHAVKDEMGDVKESGCMEQSR